MDDADKKMLNWIEKKINDVKLAPGNTNEEKQGQEGSFYGESSLAMKKDLSPRGGDKATTERHLADRLSDLVEENKGIQLCLWALLLSNLSSTYLCSFALSLSSVCWVVLKLIYLPSS